MDTEERKAPGAAREYVGDQIAVTWEPQYCVHTAMCLDALPDVFDARRRPWVLIEAAGADEIADVVRRCLSGALHYRRLDGGREEAGTHHVAVEPQPNGPLYLHGNVRIADASGGVVREDTRVALRRCGGSENKPFCDGTHRSIRFRAP